MKIKTKKQLNLPQLIEWAWENGVRDSEFQTVKDERGVFYEACFSENGSFYSNDELDSKDTFTFEVEEEITEDTVIPKPLVVFGHNGNLYIEQHNSKCINEILCLDEKVTGSVTKTIYVLNNDGTLTLIWHDGKLVK